MICILHHRIIVAILTVVRSYLVDFLFYFDLLAPAKSIHSISYFLIPIAQIRGITIPCLRAALQPKEVARVTRSEFECEYSASVLSLRIWHETCVVDYDKIQICFA